MANPPKDYDVHFCINCRWLNSQCNGSNYPRSYDNCLRFGLYRPIVQVIRQGQPCKVCSCVKIRDANKNRGSNVL